MQKWGSRRRKAEIARASRSDTHSDWSTLLGANYTYQLILTYDILLALSTYYYVPNFLFTDGPKQFADALSTSGIAGGAPESRT